MPKKSSKKSLIVLLAVIAVAAVALIVTSADFGKPMETIPPKEMDRVMAVLYKDGVPDSEELQLDSPLGTYLVTGQPSMLIMQNFRSVSSVPETADYLQVRFIYKDGRERLVRFSETDGWDYVEEPGAGAWRRKAEKESSKFRWWLKILTDKEFEIAFRQPLESGAPLELSPDYNGGEKAVWIDWSNDHFSDKLSFEPSWNESFDHDTPEGYTPERARDVRWLFIKTRTSHVYQGYWYNTRTGQRLSSSYSNSYEVTVYDLVTQECKVLAEGSNRETDIGDCMNQYFGITAE